MATIDVVAEAHREALGSGNPGLHVPARRNVDAWLRAMPDVATPTAEQVVKALSQSPYGHIFNVERASTSWLASAVKNVLPTLDLSTCVRLAMKDGFLVCADEKVAKARIQPKTLRQLVHCMHQVWLPVTEGATESLQERWRLVTDLQRRANIVFNIEVNVEEDDLISKWGTVFSARLAKLPLTSRTNIARRVLAKAQEAYAQKKSVSRFMQTCFDMEYELGERGMCDGAKEVIELAKEVGELVQ